MPQFSVDGVIEAGARSRISILVALLLKADHHLCGSMQQGFRRC
jgi:hypothetical protein